MTGVSDRWRHGAPARSDVAGVRGFELPRSLACPAAGEGNADPSWNRWIAGLPGIVDGLARRWSLRVGRPFQPGGSASWVAPARTGGGERVVLKVGFGHDEAQDEVGGLRAWDGRGTVRLLDSCLAGTAIALLLEACEPGTPLSRARPELERDVIVAGLLRRMWIKPPAGLAFRPLQAMCDRWAGQFEDDYAAARARGEEQLDAGLAGRASSCSGSYPARPGPRSC